jgi:hypothetical protein
MTPTAIELLNDRAFLEKRIMEQMIYMQQYKNYVTRMWCLDKKYYAERRALVLEGARHQIAFYRGKLDLINVS